ncbi:Glycosyltransferase involved in cell wall bisynthesis [Arenibacter nanhaiticus]|uniref:Glycosyltransferase involved in cell wall bisynthesis n=2 Tax=Arenibacter nanhaiticus TaxID=558155 RepID=A0A1M6KL72_9FLAO|nr:Glycosyltransferase involved in cell wall bisynthesis [Arenibacter nanhaiticus]
MYPKRILHVLTSMTRGGAENMVMNYYRAIDRTRVQFDFLLHRDEKSAFEDEIISLGGKIYKIPPITPKNYFLHQKVLNTFFKNHPEYQIVHSHLNALSYFILKASKKRAIPIRIAHSHTSIEPFYKKIFIKNTDLKTTVKDTIQSIIRYKVPKYATHYYSCGIKAGKWLFGSKNKEVTVINNAIDASLFTYDPIKSLKAKKTFNINGKIAIGHVGNFVEAKNHSFIIKIFHELLLIKNNFVLVLVGYGYYGSKIEKEVIALKLEQNICYLGVREDIPNILQAFDLFLFPSLYEGLPVTLIEAQASGLKIIASDTITKEVAITELITFCSLRKSEKEWAELIIKNLEYTRRNTFQEIVDGNYDIFQNSEKLQEFYLNQPTCAESMDL